MKFLLVVAMLEEMDPIRQIIKPEPIGTVKHVQLEKGHYKGHEIYLVESGIGKANAAMGTTIGIERFKPDIILNYGVVGGLGKNISIGDVIIPNDYIYSDADETAFGSPLGRVPGMPETYPLHESLENILQLVLTSSPNIKTGQIVSSDAFLYKKEQIDFVKDNFPQGQINDMEATAIAQVAYTYDLPLLSVKTISDHSDENSPKNYLESKDQVAKDSVDVLFTAIKLILQEMEN